MNTEVPNKKVNRRRRRPQRNPDRRPPAEREGERNEERAAEKTAERRPDRVPERAPSPPGRRDQGAPAPIRHRGEPRRRPQRPDNEQLQAGYDLAPEMPKANRTAADPPISPLNPEIFIYTYTLRPRSLLENYQPGPTRTERMEFENTTTL